MDNYAAAIFRIILEPGEECVLDAALQANPATIQGQVTDAQTGAGIKSAIVTLTDSVGNVIARVETDSNGRFTVSDLHSGQYTLVASVLGYITGSKTVLVLGGKMVNIVILLQKKKSLKEGFILISKRTGHPFCLTELSCPTVFNFVCKSCSNCATLYYEIEIDNRIVESSLIVDLRCFTLVKV